MVISADSRQVYRGLDVGTAKPTPAERAAVPHRGIDLVDPGERYSAGRFAADAARWVTELEPGVEPVVVGGTGLYVRALAEGLFREPPMDPDRRERLREWTTGLDGLGRWAARLDPGFTGGGRQRAARAIEVALLTGRPLTWWQQRARTERVMRPWYVRMVLPRAILHRRIEERVGAMLEAGWADEVRRLLAAGVPPDAAGLDAVGYRDMVRAVLGELPEAAVEGAIVASTRRYAKRQETWFRHQLRGDPVMVLDASEPPDALAETVARAWEQREG